MANAAADTERDDIEEPGAPADAPPKVSVDDEGETRVEFAEPRQTREERRRVRYDEVVAESRRAKEETEALRRELAEMRGAFGARQTATAAEPARDPETQQLSSVREEMETIQAAFRAGGLEAAEQERLSRRFKSLDDRRDELIADRAVRRARESIQRESQPTQGADEERVLRMEFPDVIGKPAAMQHAFGVYHQMLSDGKPPTLATQREAMQRAVERFQLRGPAQMPPVNPAVAQRFGAVSAQAGGRTSGNTVTLTREQQKMAMARWPEVDEQQAFANLAKLLRSQTDEP